MKARNVDAKVEVILRTVGDILDSQISSNAVRFMLFSFAHLLGPTADASNSALAKLRPVVEFWQDLL